MAQLFVTLKDCWDLINRAHRLTKDDDFWAFGKKAAQESDQADALVLKHHANSIMKILCQVLHFDKVKIGGQSTHPEKIDDLLDQMRLTVGMRPLNRRNQSNSETE